MFGKLKDTIRTALRRKQQDQAEPGAPKVHTWARRNPDHASGFNRGSTKRKDRTVHLEPGVARHRAVTARKRRKVAHESRRRNRHTAGVNR